MRRPSSSGIGPTPPTSATCEESIETSERLPSSFSPAGSLARTSAQPESAQALKELGPVSGSSTPGSSTPCAPDSCSSKTWPAYVPPVSTPCSGTLPRAGTMRNGTWSELPPSAPRTSAKGSGSSPGTPHVCDFPTPAASAYGSSGNGSGNNVESRGRLSLEAMARQEAWPDWPTATSGDARSSGRHTTTTGVMHPGTSLTDAVRMWPTPNARDGKGPHPPDHAKEHGAQLPDAVAAWPTPRAGDGIRGSEMEASRKARGAGGPSLTDAVAQYPSGEGASSTELPWPSGQIAAAEKSGPATRSWRLMKPVLNPDWVELLMGLPGDWTFVPSKPGNAPRPARSRVKKPRSADSGAK